MGASITFNLKDAIRTKRQERQQRERAAIAARRDSALSHAGGTARRGRRGGARDRRLDQPMRPGKVVRRFDAPATRGMHRVTWDLRAQAPALAPAIPVGSGGGGGRGGRRWRRRSGRRTPSGGAGGGGGGDEEAKASAGAAASQGTLAPPGKYTVALAKRRTA